MTTSDIIRELCDRMDISLVELCRQIGQTLQNFNKKLKRDTLSLKELIAIADVLNASFEQSFILEDGKEIKIRNRTDCFWIWIK